jgi:undecaprenyl pyrophosphate phosphatase UppP
MIFATVEATPFTITLKKLLEEEAVALLIKVVVATLPLVVLVMTLAAELKVLLVELATKLVRSVVVATPLIVVVRFVPEVVN